ESWRTPLAAGSRVMSPGSYAQDLTGDGKPDVVTPIFNINSLESFAVFDGTTGAIVRSTPLQTIASGGDQTTTGSLVAVSGDGVADLVTPLHSIGQVAIDLTASPMRTLWTIPLDSQALTANGTIAAAHVDPSGLSLLRFNGDIAYGPYARYTLSGDV